MDKIVVWPILDISRLLSPEQFQKEILSLLRAAGYDAEFGIRNGTINLMPVEEYFIPIVPKCLGSLLERDSLKNIRDYYENEAGQSPYSYFWSQECHSQRGYRMLTPPSRGYYSFIKEYAEQRNASNLLIGYSQGGLVARYLAWLSQNIFQDHELITAAITVSSPDYGSPLANEKNREHIVAGLVKMLLTIFLGSAAKAQTYLAEHPLILELIDFETLYGFLRLLGSALSHIGASRLAELIETILHWMGGLKNDPDNACYDFNMLRMEKNYTVKGAEYSVLASIHNDEEPGIPISGVVSCNSSIAYFLEEITLLELLKLILSVLEKCEGGAFPHFEEAILRGQEKGKQQDLSNEEIAGIVSDLEMIYRNEIMVEYYREISDPRLQSVLRYYNDGIAELSIPQQAHDFIIPSSYQISGALAPEVSKNLNLLNPEANHIIGASPDYPAGVANVKAIETLIQNLFDRKL